MQTINYSQLYTKFTKGLPKKMKEIFDRRFGVKNGNPETLEAIGTSFHITRERVRQIQESAFNHIKKNHGADLEAIFKGFETYFASKGGFRREEIALEELAGKKNKAYALFLLNLGSDRFARVCGKKDYHYFWVSKINSEKGVKDTLNSLVKDLDASKKLVGEKEFATSFASKYNLSQETIASYVEISKNIQKNKDGKLGLISWPEVKPRGVRDKAFLVFKQENKPLHFRDITNLIDGLGYDASNKQAHAQTVHNELIKDARFVLVGRGTYALAEWGYVPGTIKDIITKVLSENKGAAQEHVIKEVLSQRMVAKNTVLINLNNRKHFHKDSEGKYFVKEVQTA